MVPLLYDHISDVLYTDNDCNEFLRTKYKDLDVDLVSSVSAVVRSSLCDPHPSDIVRSEDTPRRIGKRNTPKFTKIGLHSLSSITYCFTHG